MKSIKLMCSGIFLIAAAAWCAAADGGNGSVLGGVAFLLPIPGASFSSSV